MRSVSRIAALVTATGLLGCGAVAEPAPELPTAANVATAADHFSLPLDRYLPLRDPQERRTYNSAVDRALEACAAERGVHLTFPDRPEPSYAKHRRRYGVDRVADARTVGFGPPPRDPEIAALENFDVGLSQAQLLVLHDPHTSDGGCVSAVGRRAGGDDPRWDAVAATESLLNSTLIPALGREPAATALNRWRDCFKTATGVESASPLSAATDVVADEVDPVEAALADLSCKAQSALVPSWQVAETDLQQEIIVANSDLLDRALAVQLEAMERAASGMWA